MKNNKNSNKILGVLVLISVIVIVVLSVLAGNDGQALKPPFTVYNSKDSGVSLLFDVLKKMGKNVTAGFEYVDETVDTSKVLVIIEPLPQFFSEDEENDVLDWVDAGGVLMYFSGNQRSILKDDRNHAFIDSIGKNSKDNENSEQEETLEKYEIYAHGSGIIVVGDSRMLQNENILNNYQIGENFVLVLESIFDSGEPDIVFWEFVHGYRNKPTLYKSLPQGVKLVYFNFLMLVVVVIFIVSKRFGRATTYYEEIEREENEHIKTLAIIFKNAGKGEIALENLYTHFLHECAAHFSVTYEFARQNILELWEKIGFEHYEMLKTLDSIIINGHKINTKRRTGLKHFKEQVKNAKLLIQYIQSKGRI